MTNNAIKSSVHSPGPPSQQEHPPFSVPSTAVGRTVVDLDSGGDWAAILVAVDKNDKHNMSDSFRLGYI